MEIALYEPDIPQNTGTMIRLCACLGVRLHIIEPCGFAYGEAKMRRAMMDYYDLASIVRHCAWQSFLDWRQEHHAGRLILLTTRATQRHTGFAFRPGDMLLLGRESSGAPEHVHAAADDKVKIALRSQARSLNVALAGAMVLGEALRQTNAYPES